MYSKTTFQEREKNKAGRRRRPATRSKVEDTFDRLIGAIQNAGCRETKVVSVIIEPDNTATEATVRQERSSGGAYPYALVNGAEASGELVLRKQENGEG